MRELVYLSQAKLQQFRKSASKRDGLGGTFKISTAGLGLPAVEAGLAYDAARAAAGTTPTLDQAEKYIRSKWPVRWWTEETEPGEWIQFETRLAYAVLSDGLASGQPVLFFWGRDDPRDERSTQLLLHGSPQHLIQAATGGPPSNRMSPSLSAGMFNYLNAVADGRADGAGLSSADRRLLRVIQELRELAPDYSAAWLSGMARTSFVADLRGRRLVVASPLFVEHIPPPR
ncbi:SAVMC3_10250 family protein [Kribbella sp. NPDC005582]|uniref:SAVMC3_10250 family protein n=1 Tax=Kribbella sp. NPDC005582 TaxID=3156893 RepID=UPI0033B08F43